MEPRAFFAVVVSPSAQKGSRMEFSRELDSPLKITMAALGAKEPKSATATEPSQLWLQHQDDAESEPVATLLCTLAAGSCEQHHLAINFNPGDRLTFSCTGAYKICISGYKIGGFFDDDDDENGPFAEVDDGESVDDEGSSDASNENDISSGSVEDMMKTIGQVAQNDDDDDDDDDDEDDDDESDDDDDDEESAESKVAQVVRGQKRKAEKEELAKPTKKSKELENMYAKQKQAERKADPPQAVPKKEAAPKKETRKFGVVVTQLKTGRGNTAHKGQVVKMYYTGRLAAGKKKVFDSLQKGPPFSFTLGAGEVIKGWDVGVDGIQMGEKRHLYIPASAGYGRQGAPPDIPRNADLEFTVECMGIGKKRR